MQWISTPPNIPISFIYPISLHTEFYGVITVIELHLPESSSCNSTSGWSSNDGCRSIGTPLQSNGNDKKISVELQPKVELSPEVELQPEDLVGLNSTTALPT